MAGPSAYDLSGTGTGVVAGVRGEYAARPWLAVQGSASWFRYELQGGGSLHYLFPEAGVFGRLPLGYVPRTWVPGLAWRRTWTDRAPRT